MTLAHLATIPILRSFDEAKAREFYVDWLGFTVDWEHRFEPWAPLYMQVSRAGIVFHISEHHGDGSPGAHVRVQVTGVRDYHAELIGKAYKNNSRPRTPRMGRHRIHRDRSRQQPHHLRRGRARGLTYHLMIRRVERDWIVQGQVC